MKKILLSAIAATALLAGVASANAQSAFDGVYVGAGAGFGAGSADVERTVAFGRTVEEGWGLKGVHGGLFGGYGLTFSNIYVGIEGAYDFSNIGSEYKVGSYKEELTRDMNGSIVGRVGYLLSRDTMVYGLAGWNYGHWELKDNTSEDETFKRWVHGVKLGAGVEHNFGSFFGRLGYDVDISKKEFKDFGVDFQPVTHKASVGVGVRF